MPALVPHEGRGAQGGLGRHLQGFFRMEADLDAALAGGPDGAQEEGHAACAEGSGGDHVLFVDDEGGAHGAEELRRLIQCVGVPGLGRQARHGFAERDRGVRHGPHDRHVGADAAADGGDLGAGDDGYEQVLVGHEPRGDFEQDLVEVLRLDRDQHRAARGHGGLVVGGHAEASGSEVRQPVGAPAGEVDVCGGVRAGGYESFGDGAADIAGAQYGDSALHDGAR